MTDDTVNGSGNGARSGAQTLVLLATPLNARILDALDEGPKAQAQIRFESGSPAQSTLRSHLGRLEKSGIVSRRRRNAFPGAIEYELDGGGRQLRFVIETLNHWLSGGPNGQLALGSEPARSAVKALAEGWSARVTNALATGPVTLTELARLIPEVSYPSLERRLGTLRAVGQIEGLPSGNRGTPYAPTGWLRRGVAPLIVAAAWEQRNGSNEAAPVCLDDVASALALVLPLLRLPDDLTGECRIAVESPNGAKSSFSNLLVDVRGGTVDLAEVGGSGKPVAWAAGSIGAWLRTVVDTDPAQLELGGDGILARALIDGLHEVLFGTNRILALDSEKLIEEDGSN